MYGEDAPAYTASYEGFVNGDEGEVTGLRSPAAPPPGPPWATTRFTSPAR